MSTKDSELALLDEPQMASEMSSAQLDLLLGDDKPKVDRSKEPFSYTAERLWRDRPDVAKAAIKLLAEPREVMPYRRIMGKLHMSYHLLRQLELSASNKIADEKKTLGDLMFTATTAFAERAITEATDPNSKLSGKDAMIAVGIGAEKLMMFRGEASQKVDLTVTVDIGSKIDQAFKKITDEFAVMKRATARVVLPELEEGENVQRPTSNVQRPTEEA